MFINTLLAVCFPFFPDRKLGPVCHQIGVRVRSSFLSGQWGKWFINTALPSSPFSLFFYILSLFYFHLDINCHSIRNTHRNILCKFNYQLPVVHASISININDILAVPTSYLTLTELLLQKPVINEHSVPFQTIAASNVSAMTWKCILKFLMF